MQRNFAKELKEKGKRMARKSFRGTGGGIDTILGGIDQNDPDIKLTEADRTVDVEETLSSREKRQTSTRSIANVIERKTDEPPAESHAVNVGDVRSTMIFALEQLDRLRALAYWERQPIKSVLKKALAMYFESKGKSYVDNALADWKDSQSH